MIHLFVRPARRGDVGEIQTLDVDTIEELLPRMGVAVGKAVDLLYARVIQLLSRQGSPRTSSAPGEPPEMDSGELARSMKKRRPGKGGKRVKRGWVESRLPWALAHEVGSRKMVGGGIRRLPARPYMRPALAQVEAEVDRIFEAL